MRRKRESITIPMPMVRPLGIPVTKEAVQEVWDTYVKPDQDAEVPPSAEMRILMAILRSVYEGLL